MRFMDEEEDRQYLRQQLDKGYCPADPYLLYNKKAIRDEENFVEDCNQTMDTLLVFAGLFSAVITALIVETYKDLRPEPEAFTEKLLLALLKRQGNSSDDGPIERDQFSAPKGAIVTNSLFFASLAFSLLSALAAILAKQWTRKVFLGIKKHDSARERAREYSQKRKGIDDWGIPGMIAFIPMMLHLALACFFAGLIVWLRSLDRLIYALIIVIAGLALIIYLSAAIIPSFQPNAPFRWPVSFAVSSILALLPERRNPFPLPLSIPSDVSLLPRNTPVTSTPIDRADPPTDITHEKAIDEVDLLVFSNILDQTEVPTETEAVVDALRCRLMASSPRIGRVSPAFDLILEKAVNLAMSCIMYQGGVYDIRPGVPLERLTTVSQFVEVALQTVYVDVGKHAYTLQNFMKVAELMLERANFIQSLREIALYASILARLYTRYRIFDNFNKSSDTINALRDLGPKPRSWEERGLRYLNEPSKPAWTFQELHQYQQIVTPYVLAMTYLVAERYPPGTTEPTSKLFIVLCEELEALLHCSKFPIESERKDNFPILREALESMWLSHVQVSQQFKCWMELLLPVTLSFPKIANDGSHYIKRKIRITR